MGGESCGKGNGLMMMLRRRAEDRRRCGSDLRNSLTEELPQTDNDSTSTLHAIKLERPAMYLRETCLSFDRHSSGRTPEPTMSMLVPQTDQTY